MAEKKEKKDVKVPKKTKNTTSVKLPNARKSIKRQRHMAQGRAEWSGLMELITGILVVLLILFIFLGGVNQRAFVETAKEWSQTIGEKFQQIFHPDQVIINDDGVYYDVDGDGNPG